MVTEKTLFYNELDHFKGLSPAGVEYWMARDIQSLLGYLDWRKFEGVVEERLWHAKVLVVTQLSILSKQPSW